MKKKKKITATFNLNKSDEYASIPQKYTIACILKPTFSRN